jgi:hypothetical protein
MTILLIIKDSTNSPLVQGYGAATEVLGMPASPYKKFANSLYYKELHENSLYPMGETVFFMFII